MKKADPQFTPIYQSLGQYWGEQPGTSGPVYVGAFVLTLFVLGLFIVKGLVEAMDGEIRLYSNEECGFCVKVFMPIAEIEEDMV